MQGTAQHGNGRNELAKMVEKTTCQKKKNICAGRESAGFHQGQDLGSQREGDTTQINFSWWVGQLTNHIYFMGDMKQTSVCGRT